MRQFLKVMSIKLTRLMALSLCLFISSIQFMGMGYGLANEARPIPRTIIALYDGDQEASPDVTRLHRYAEMPLNYLGFKLRYVDVAKALPTLQKNSDIAGLISWFTAPVKSPFPYLKWATDAVNNGHKFVVLEEVGGNSDDQQVDAMAVFLSQIGLLYTGDRIEFTPATRLINNDPALTEFEAQFDPVLPSFPVVKVLEESLNPSVELQVPNREGGGRSVAIVAGSGGGYAAPGYVISTEIKLKQARWLFNPFTFFKRAFAEENWPKPDVTTQNGLRIFFSHVDGLGLSDVAIQQGQRLLIPDLFYDQIGLAYKDLPVSVALTVGDVDPLVGGQSALREKISRIWALPQIEPALNGYTQLYDWSFFNRYDRKREEALLQGAPISGWVNLKNVLRMGRDETDLETKKYVSNGRDLPREYMRFPFSREQEAEGALKVAESLLPKDKRIKLYQWTGDARPDEAMIAATREIGLVNINGGGAQLKLSQPSITDISPFSIQVGNERQINSIGGLAAMPEENSGKALEQMRAFPYVMRRTEKPYRLTAYNLHYDLQLLGVSGGLQAVRNNLDKVTSGDYFPVFTSDYAGLVQDYFKAEIIRVGPLQWIIKNRGSVNTLRMDAVSGLHLDLEESKGVLGASVINGQIYISLDSAVDKVILVARADKNKLNEKVGLKTSGWKVTHLKRETCGWSYQAEGFGQGKFSWYNVPLGEYTVSASKDRIIIWSKQMKSTDNNMLEITIPETAPSLMTIDVKCHFAGKS